MDYIYDGDNGVYLIKLSFDDRGVANEKLFNMTLKDICMNERSRRDISNNNLVYCTYFNHDVTYCLVDFYKRIYESDMIDYIIEKNIKTK